jgi:hypothetical protein
MSSSPAVRTLRLPAPDFDKYKIPRTKQPARNWFRVHQPVHSPRYFSLNPAHRFSPQDCPYPVLYLGVNFQGIKYKSRFNDRACLAVFQRDGLEKSMPDSALGALSTLDEAADWLDKHRVRLY